MRRITALLDKWFTDGTLDFLDYEKAMRAVEKDRDEYLGLQEEDEDYT